MISGKHIKKVVARLFGRNEKGVGNVYDHAGRLLRTYHSINGATPVLLAQNEYNEIGQVVDRKLHSTDGGSTFKQSIDYRYNIRGWKTSINNSSLANDGGTTNDDANDLFGINISYNDAISGMNNTPQFNGNVSAIRWSNYLAQAGTKERGYSFGYDAMNRLLTSTHQEKITSWAQSNSFHENSTYDLNGNFISIYRLGANASVMDNMAYAYSGGNQPVSITDSGDLLNGYVDGNLSGSDFTYDANGNTTIDKDAGITSNITYNHLNLVQQVTNSVTGDYMKNTYDATGRKLSEQVYSSSNVLKKQLDYVGEFIYQNDTLQFINHEEGRVAIKNTTTPEYQYFLVDHLGNNRLLFTSQPKTDINTATYETANVNVEQSEFLRYDDARRINSTLFDHTHNGVTSYSERLSGSANEKTGIARSMSVMPGDTIKMEVYDKYVDGSNPNNTAALTQLLAQIIAGTASAGTVIDGANYSTNGITPFPYTGLAGEGSSTGNGPKAYMNWLIFDRNYVFKNGGYVQMTNAAKEDGTNVPFEKLSAWVVINEPGYVYVYLSNENPTPLEVYFDDFKVTQVKSPIVENNDYYPYGGSMTTSYTREGSLFNRWKYSNKELINDLNLGWMDYGVRQRRDFDPRWRTIDPLAEMSRRWSPYNYAIDNPMRYIDPDGMIWKDQKEADELKNNIQKKMDGLSKDKAGLQAKLNDKDKPVSDKERAKIESKISDIDARSGRLESSKGDIDKLGADQDHTYDLVSGSGNEHHVTQGDDGVINIEGSSDALHVHEIKHVSQSLDKGKLEFSAEKLLKPSTLTGEVDEIKAYQAQYSFSPSSLPKYAGSIGDINRQWVGTITNGDGKPIYPAINQLIQNAIEQNKINKKMFKKQGNE
jgi:RHS repeat-associated protein